MDFSALTDSLTATFAETIPNLLSAVLILIVGSGSWQWFCVP
jgi:hypothetical protein